jgi:nucleoside-diphosphate-sugar epimerase
VPRFGGYTVNMLHYEDAARLALAILRGDGSGGGGGGGYRGRVFVGTDGHPLTFQQMVDACVQSGLFSGLGSGSVRFTGTPEGGGGLGKVVTNEQTRAALGGWAPKYASFQDFFLKQGGQDFYNSSAAAASMPVGAPHPKG